MLKVVLGYALVWGAATTVGLVLSHAALDMVQPIIRALGQ